MLKIFPALVKVHKRTAGVGFKRAGTGQLGNGEYEQNGGTEDYDISTCILVIVISATFELKTTSQKDSNDVNQPANCVEALGDEHPCISTCLESHRGRYRLS
jgi:hypothetical protein